jgi:hypothetical protein
MVTVFHASMDLTWQLLERRASGQSYIVTELECSLCEEDRQSVVVYATLDDGGTILTSGFELPNPVPNPDEYDTRPFEALLVKMLKRLHA